MPDRADILKRIDIIAHTVLHVQRDAGTNTECVDSERVTDEGARTAMVHSEQSPKVTFCSDTGLKLPDCHSKNSSLLRCARDA